MAPGERIGVLGLGQQHDAHVHALLEDHVDTAQRRMDTRRIAVVDDRDVLRKAVQQAYLLRRERRTGRRDDVLDPGLVHRNDVGIALHHDGEVLLLDGFLGEIETVEFALLAVYLALGRILVLGDFLVGAERTAAERHDTARNIVDREHHPVVETVEERTVALALERQARREEEFLLVPGGQRVLGHLVALGRAETEAEFLNRGVGHAARLAEIGHADAHPLALVVQIVGEVVGRPTIERKHGFAVVVAPLLLGGELLLLDLDAVALGHHLERFGIGDVLVLHQERHGVAALAAAETLVDALGGRNDERRGLLVVERTARLVVHAFALERDEVADNIHDIGGGIDAVYCLPVDHTCKDRENRIKN